MEYFQYAEFLLYAIVVAPVLAYAQGKVAETLEKRDAWKDAQGNKYLKPGKRFNQIREAGNASKLCGAGSIVSVAYGRVEIVQDDDGGRMVFSLREWKALHPEWSATNNGRK